MAKYFSFFLLFLTGTGLLSGQNLADTTLQLDAVLVTETRLSLSAVGSREQVLDSADLSFLPATNVGEVLMQQTPIFIRNLGPSRSASSSIRGAGGNHTAVLWNGFNIQSPMLGQTDLSLLPVSLVDEVRLEYGGGSALWGNGPIGGVVHLNSLPRFGEGLRAGVRSAAGSFGLFHQGAYVDYSGENYLTRTRGFYQTAQNDFTYTDGMGEERELPNGATEQYGFLQENYFKLPNEQRLGVHVWYQHAEREQPPTTLSETSEAQQTDDWLRLLLDWEKRGDDLNLYARAALFRDRLQYNDPQFGLDTDDRTLQAIGEVEGQYRLNPRQSLTFGINNTWARAESVSFEDNPTRNRLALFAAHHLVDASGDWRLVLAARQEFIDEGSAPFVPSVEVRGRLAGNLQVKGALSRNYRLPTFNDLYFSDPFSGGNPDLVAETGWSQELGLSYGTVTPAFGWKAALTGFNRNVNDWIIWLPDDNFFFSPRNIQEVWSRGLEVDLEARGAIGSARLDWTGRYEYVRSTNEKEKRPDDPAVGKQLPYVPDQRVQTSLRLNLAGFTLGYWHTYTSRVFVLEDNSERLPEYHLGELRFGKQLTIQRFKGQAWVRVRNLWDEDYQVVAFFPMPGRHFEVGVQLGFVK